MIVWILIMAGTVILDQLTKWLAFAYLREYGSAGIPIIKNVLHLTFATNDGAAFGMLDDHRWVFISISIIAIIGLFIYLWKNRNQGKLLCISLSFIVGGGIGNMIDRCLNPYGFEPTPMVIDFIDFRLINFAVFNIADSFVCIGVALMVIYIIRDEIKNSQKSKETLENAEVIENAENSTDSDS